jgi:hypothetical protein
METRWRGLQQRTPFAGCVFGQVFGVVTAADINLGFMIFAMPPPCIGWFRGIARGRM